MPEFRPFGHDDYTRNSERVRGQDIPCAWCGRAVKVGPDGDLRHTVVVIDGGANFGTLDSDTTDPGYMGGHPVGPNCKKLLSAAGVAVYTAPSAKRSAATRKRP